MRERGVPSPELVLVTGDIAFSGASRVREAQHESTEYQDAARWLRLVGERLGLQAERIFVVPGNHDVQRTADREPEVAQLVEDLREGRMELDAALAHPARRALLARRQANFLAWSAGFAPACAEPSRAPEARLFWTHRLEAAGGLRVRLVGLNTALLCANDLDRGRLRVGNEQLAHALLLPPVEPHELVVVLTHHPFRGQWLADEQQADAWFRNHAHLHLSGHVHEADAEQARSGAGGLFVRVVAGAAHGEQVPAGVPAGHGYNLAAVLPSADGQLVLRVWPRRWSDKNKAFVEDRDNLPEGQSYSEHPLRLTLRPTPPPAGPPVPRPTREQDSPAYDVALSFAGEDRTVAERCAELLRASGYRVFYDRWEQHELLGKDLVAHFDSVYRGAARYCLVFISRHYMAKMWTRQELRSAQARALMSHHEYLLPIRLDDTPVPGLPDTVGYVDLRSHSVEELVRLLERKLGPVHKVADVERLLRSASTAERLRGLDLAVREREPRHLERLLELLRTEPSPENREQAALALAELRDPRAMEGLLAALEDPLWGVRSQAGWGLVHLGPAVREKVLRVTHTSTNADAVEMARLVLERLRR